MKITRIISVVDTRSYEEHEDGKFHAIPGSGVVRQCDRCGREHEVHATVELEDGKTAIIGTGCMTAEDSESAEKLRSMDAAAKRLARLRAEKAAYERILADWQTIRAEVKSIPVPEPTITLESTTYHGHNWFVVKHPDLCNTVRAFQDDVAPEFGGCGGYALATPIWNMTHGLSRERWRCYCDSWYAQRMEERGYDYHKPYPKHDFDKLIARAERALAEQASDLGDRHLAPDL